jgi:hypothetical protein
MLYYLSYAINPFCFGYLFIFGGTGVRTQDFMLPRQILYCLSHFSSPCFGYF